MERERKGPRVSLKGTGRVSITGVAVAEIEEGDARKGLQDRSVTQHMVAAAATGLGRNWSTC